MIIPVLLILSCLRTDTIIPNNPSSSGLRMFSMKSVENTSLSKSTLQEKAQVYFLRGIQENSNDGLIQARAIGFQCIQEISPFSFSKLEELPIRWSEHPVRTKGICIENAPSLLLPIPADQISVACMTWVLGSWSQLLQEYRLQTGLMNAKSMVILSTWLEEQRQCLDSPWVSFAIATGLLYGHDPKEHKTRVQERYRYADELIESLWNHPELKDVVRYWYIDYRRQEGGFSSEDIGRWIVSIQELTQTERMTVLLEKLKGELRERKRKK